MDWISSGTATLTRPAPAFRAAKALRKGLRTYRRTAHYPHPAESSFMGIPGPFRQEEPDLLLIQDEMGRLFCQDQIQGNPQIHYLDIATVLPSWIDYQADLGKGHGEGIISLYCLPHYSTCPAINTGRDIYCQYPESKAVHHPDKA